MEYLFSFLILVALLALLMLPGNRNVIAARAGNPKPATSGMLAADPTPAPWSTPVTQRLTREEIARRLKTLSASEPPKNLSMGAMCYAPRIYNPQKAEYVCPKCGAKTLYPERMEQLIIDIPKCRRYVKEIRQIALQLDESQFCKKCSPSVKSPSLVLVVSYPGEKKTYRHAGVNSNDLLLIQEFLEGKAVHKGERDSETSLKSNMERIQLLLGIKESL